MYVIMMALHAGMYTTVVRHASEILHELVGSDNVQVTTVINCVLKHRIKGLVKH